MKVNFTRLATLALAIGVNYSAFCQNWLTNGNNVTAGQFLGSTNNQPLLFRTANVNRLKLNHSVSYDINGASGTNLSREGYLLLGKNNNFSSTANPIYKEGAFSLLHLNGYNGNTIDELGYRNWMQTGITFTGNRDLLRYRSVS